MTIMLTDRQIKAQGTRLLSPYNEQQVQAIGYDLTSETFYRLDEKEVSFVELQPMESVFVRCKENISLPDNMAAKVTLRNSRIRQGLLLTAPVYYPGHKTPVFFRVTNVSASEITLKQGCGIASIMFEQLSEDVEHPYNGTFQQEKQYIGMGTYKDVYKSAMSRAAQKIDELKSTEKNIYTNVLALLAIFVAVFSVINVNVSLANAGDPDLTKLVVWNLCTLGAVGFLVSLTKTSGFSKFGMCASAILLIVALLMVA
jgi:deoxycytidine triphosphate deaminase